MVFTPLNALCPLSERLCFHALLVRLLAFLDLDKASAEAGALLNASRTSLSDESDGV